MDIDRDILYLLKPIETGYHGLERAIQLFLASLPGYRNRLHSPKTIKKYISCLLNGPNSLILFLKNKGIHYIEEISKEEAELHKDFLLNKIDPQTVRSYITAIRLLLQYSFRLGWHKIYPDDSFFRDFGVGI